MKMGYVLNVLKNKTKKRRKKMQHLDFKKLVRFIKTDKEDIWKLYFDLDYEFWKGDSNSWIIGIPKSDKIANIGITAHYDTVLEDSKWYKKEKDGRKIFWDKRRTTLFGEVNGDDRAGCYGIYEVAKRAEYKPYVLLFDEEESGSIGCKHFIKNYKSIAKDLKLDFIGNCGFFISLDRKGEKDAVFYTSDNPDFIKYIEEYGFKEEIGLYSDITLLEKEYKKCGVNLSVGYKENHTDHETLNIKVLDNTIGKVIEICNDNGKNNHNFKYIPTYNSIKGYSCYTGTKWIDKLRKGKSSGIMAKKFHTLTGKNDCFEDICDNCSKTTSVKVVKEYNGYKEYVLCKKCRKLFYKDELELDNLGLDYIDEQNVSCEVCGIKTPKNELYQINNEIICEDCYFALYSDKIDDDGHIDRICDYCGEVSKTMYSSVWDSFLCTKCYNEISYENQKTIPQIRF
jgi:hypothetical protein